MNGFFRSFAVAALAIGLVGAARVEAQSVPVAEAQAFMGAWTLAVDAQGQAFEMGLAITDEGGNVAAEVSSELGAQKISQITKNADKLVLSYSMDAQGQQIPIVITLTPTAAGLDAALDFAGGMFQAAGKGTKR